MLGRNAQLLWRQHDPFQQHGTRFEFFNADAIFRMTLHPEERVRLELSKLESKWAAHDAAKQEEY